MDGGIGKFDLTYDNPQTLVKKKKKKSPFFFSPLIPTKHIQKSSAADFFLGGVGFGSGATAPRFQQLFKVP